MMDTSNDVVRSRSEDFSEAVMGSFLKRQISPAPQQPPFGSSPSSL